MGILGKASELNVASHRSLVCAIKNVEKGMFGIIGAFSVTMDAGTLLNLHEVSYNNNVDN